MLRSTYFFFAFLGFSPFSIFALLLPIFSANLIAAFRDCLQVRIAAGTQASTQIPT